MEEDTIMKKRYTFCAALALIGGIASAQVSTNVVVSTAPVTAQPATTGTQPGAPITTMTATEANASFAGQRPRTGGRLSRNAGGPFTRLEQAKSLADLTDQQRQQIQEFIDTNKEESEQLQATFRETLSQARNTTGTREDRQRIMQDVRQKFDQAETRVDTFLKEVLTPEQQATLERRNAFRDRAQQRVREGRDRRTTGTASGEMRRRGPRPDGDNRARNLEDRQQRQRIRQLRESRTQNTEAPAPASTPASEPASE